MKPKMKPKVVIGIDPGATGAIALLGDNLLLAEDWPGDVSGAADLLRSWAATYHIQMAGLERVASRPGQGVSSVFKFGENFGCWQGLLAALAVPVVLLTPQTWQKRITCASDGLDPKARSMAVARRLFPDAPLTRKKDHGRADALLLAEVIRRHYLF